MSIVITVVQESRTERVLEALRDLTSPRALVIRDGNRKRISRFIDRVNTRWLRMEARVAEGALLYARAGRVDRIFCGHTHVATHQSRHGVDYYNSGCWINANPTYLTIDEEGVRIRKYEGPKYEYEPVAETSPELLLPAGDLFDPASMPAFGNYESLRC